MAKGEDILLLIFDSIAFTVGGPGYIFILINCVLQGTNQRVTPYIIIVFSMCISNLTMVCIQVLTSILTINGNISLCMNTVIDGPLLSLLSCSLWSSTWLSLYYKLKIVPSLSPLYSWLKRKFNAVFPWLMFSSSLLSFMIAISLTIGDLDISDCYTANVSIDDSEIPSSRFSLQIQLYCAFVSLSILLTFKSVMMILLSLYRHVRHLQRSAEGFRDSALEAHYMAAKTVTVLFLFSFFFFILQLVSYLYEEGSWIYYMTAVALSLLLTLCPLILVFGNTNLKLEAKRAFRCIFHSLFVTDNFID